MAVATVIRACGHTVELTLDDPGTAEREVKAILASYCLGTDDNGNPITGCTDDTTRRHPFGKAHTYLANGDAFTDQGPDLRRQPDTRSYYHRCTPELCTLVLGNAGDAPAAFQRMTKAEARAHMRKLAAVGHRFELHDAATFAREAWAEEARRVLAAAPPVPDPVAVDYRECDRRGELLEPVIDRDLGHSILGQAAAVVNAIPDPEREPQFNAMTKLAEPAATPHECHTRSHTDGGWRKRGFTLKPNATPFERDGWTLYCRHQVTAAGSPAAATAERVGAGA